MGLDIYLEPIASHEQSKRHDQEWDALWNRKDRGEITQEQFDELRKDITPYASHEDVPSAAFPDHLFNRRYLRSSYNPGGFNHAVPELLGTAGDADYPEERGSLYWIFEPMGRAWDGDEGTLTEADIPKLTECRKRAEQVADELANSDRLRVLTVSANQLTGIDWLNVDSGKALRLVREKAAELVDAEPSEWLSSRDMEWFGGTLNVVAIVPGGTKQFFREERWPAAHVVYRASDQGFESYVQSTRIVAELCDEAIALIERDGSAHMAWSG